MNFILSFYQMVENTIQFYDRVYIEYRSKDSINKCELISKFPKYLSRPIKLDYLNKLKYLDVLKYVQSLDLHTNINAWIKKFIKDSGTAININVIRNSKDVKDINLDHLESLKTGLTQLNQFFYLTTINEILDNITEINFVEFLRYQTSGYDHENYYYLDKYFKFAYDKNEMIIFTNEFSFNNRIKKEALFIYWILRLIKTRPLFKKYMPRYLSHSLQKTLEYNNLPLNENMRPDICFNEIRMIIEINENHHNDADVKVKDNIKKSFLRLNGYNLTKLVFNEIYTKQTIKAGTNINSIVLKSKYLTKFKNEFEGLIEGALLRFEDFREDYLKDIFADSLVLKNKRLTDTIIYTNRTKSDLMNTIKFQDKIDIPTYVKQFEDTTQVLVELNASKVRLQEIVSDVNSSAEVANLFKLKKNSKASKIPKNITLEQILEVFKIRIAESNPNAIDNFILYMASEGVIRIGTNHEDIHGDWTDLTQLIHNYPGTLRIKKVLELYHREVENIYDSIIAKMEVYTDSMISNEHYYNIYLAHNNSKIKQNCHDLLSKANLKYHTNLTKKNIEIDKLKDKLDKDENLKEIGILKKWGETMERNYLMEKMMNIPCSGRLTIEDITAMHVAMQATIQQDVPEYTEEMCEQDLATVYALRDAVLGIDGIKSDDESDSDNESEPESELDYNSDDILVIEELCINK